jgi:hypothetical protein
MNKLDKIKREKAIIEREIKAIAVIEDEFKALGKCLYALWKSPKIYNFEGIMQNFDGLIKKLIVSKENRGRTGGRASGTPSPFKSKLKEKNK